MNVESPYSPHLLYLGISGVMHPSRSLYESVHGRPPEDDGHREYEAAPVLAHLLRGWPHVRIILTSTLPWRDGLLKVATNLGTELACRVLGFTYADLTAKAQLGPRGVPLGNADYWRLTKAEIVRLHAGWWRAQAWVAVDDETLNWTEAEHAQQFAMADGLKGLLDPKAQNRLLTRLQGNFGPAEAT